MSIEARLAELGITLPAVPAPAGNYVHAVRTGNLLLPMGFINTLHAPIFYRGNFRPELERRIKANTGGQVAAE